jgi:glycosyltransferase involved in cell wall biosynthesis
MARYLRRAGHDVTVVATDLYGRLLPDDEEGILRVGDLRSSRALRAALRRGDAPETPGQQELPTTPLLTKVIVPDANLATWIPGAYVALRKFLRAGRVDCVVTSGPPESVHVLGLLLGSKRPAWIADFRDGWTFEPLREQFPTSFQRRVDEWLERRVARGADVAVGATRPIAEDLAARFGAAAVHVPNGWDPEAVAGVRAARHILGGGGGTVTLAYTGTFSGVRGSDPRPLLQALRTLRVEHGLRRMRLVVAGRLTTVERKLIADDVAAGVVEHVGLLDRADAIGLQRSADALVLLTSRNVSEATGKIYEYLAAGRPILALAENNEAERIIRETRTGVAVAPEDVGAIMDALRRVASGELAASYEPRDLERYSYPGPAEAMAEAVEEAIGRRKSR